jgi:hypothetical protein
MFGTVLDKLDTFFGRSFLLSRFFPFLVFLGLNFAVAYAMFPDARSDMRKAVAASAQAGAIVYLLAGFLLIAAIAYTMAPFSRITLRLLEGDWMLSSAAFVPLGRSLILEQSLRQRKLFRSQEALLQESTALPTVTDIKARLAPFAQRGIARKRVDDREAIDDSEKSIKRLRRKQLLREPLLETELDEVIETLAEAVGYNSVAKDNRLNELYIEFTQTLAPYAVQIAGEREARANQLREQFFSIAELAPTRLGNLSAALRSYCATRYSIDFDTFWPRFLLAIRKDDKLNAAIAAAKIQLDFAVLSFALTACSVAAWVCVAAVEAGTHMPLLLTLAVGPPIVAIWLRVVHATYEEFADTVRAAIDNGRFDLMTALRQPLPASLQDEQLVWKRLSELAVFNTQEPDIPYKHPSG